MISRRGFLLAGVAALGSATVTASAAFAEVEAVVREAIARGDLPGAVLHVRTRGRVLYEEAFGRARLEDDAALTPGHLFPVASLTKPVIAAAILQLGEAGKLRVDDPVGAYLPEFARPRVLLTYDAATGVMTTRPARRPMTLRHLLTHTAGIHHGHVEIDAVLGAIYHKAGVVHDSRLLLAEKMRRLGPLPPRARSRRGVDVWAELRRAGPRRGSRLGHVTGPVRDASDLRAARDAARVLLRPARRARAGGDALQPRSRRPAYDARRSVRERGTLRQRGRRPAHDRRRLRALRAGPGRERRADPLARERAGDDAKPDRRADGVRVPLGLQPRGVHAERARAVAAARRRLRLVRHLRHVVLGDPA